MFYYLFDSGITPYSTIEEIQEWIDYLLSIPDQQNLQVKDEIAEANRTLELAKQFAESEKQQQ